MTTEVTTVVCGSAGAVGSGACSETAGALETWGVGVGVEEIDVALETSDEVAGVGVDTTGVEAPSVTYCVMTDSRSVVAI